MSKHADRSAPRLASHSRSSSKGVRARVGRQLWEWASEEMRYSPGREGSLGQEDLQMLVRGEMTEFWEHVIKHVKSPSNADVVRDNIFLHTASGEGGALCESKTGAAAERGVLERDSSQLRREEASLRMAVQQLERDIAQLRENITELDKAGSGVRSEASRLSRGSALLSAHSQASQETINVVAEFARRIRARADLFRPAEREASFFRKRGVEEKRMGEDGSTALGLESACTHEVRNICSQLEEALSSKNAEGQRVTERKMMRERSWKRIESLLSHYPPAEILSSLVEVTQQAAYQLHSHTDAIDLNRDARQLKYSYDVAGVQDMSEGEPSLLHAVEEQLLAAQLSHIQRSVESERAQKTAREAQSRAVELQAMADQLLHECYHNQQDSEAVELAKLHTRLDLECAGSLAALEKLSALCSSLGCARDQRKAALEELQAKHKRIKEFAQIADSKQRHIQALVVHNSSAKDRLLKQSAELQVYVQQNVLSHSDRLNAMVGLLRDGVAQEVRLFTGLALDRLMKPASLELPTCDLSISRLNAELPSGHPLWNVIMQSLKLPLYSSPDRILTKLLDSLEEVGSLDRNVAKVNDMLQEMRVIAVDKEGSQTILQRCRDHDQDLLERGVLTLQECLSRASCGLADCEKTAETLEHWWVQPAQFLTPWATLGGMTAGQWLEKWRVVAAKLGELLDNYDTV